MNKDLIERVKLWLAIFDNRECFDGPVPINTTSLLIHQAAEQHEENAKDLIHLISAEARKQERPIMRQDKRE